MELQVSKQQHKNIDEAESCSIDLIWFSLCSFPRRHTEEIIQSPDSTVYHSRFTPGWPTTCVMDVIRHNLSVWVKFLFAQSVWASSHLQDCFASLKSD